MRRFLPALIVIVGLGALAIDFLPLSRPLSDPPEAIDTRLGLDLQGGLRGEYRARPTDTSPITQESLATIRTIIENRINRYGVSEPIVQTQGSDRIVVEIPGITNEQDVRDLIGSTGLLEFIGVTPGTPGVQQGSVRPPGQLLFTGIEVSSAAPGTDPNGRRAIDIRLRDAGARIFDEYAAQHANQQDQVAIVLDGVVQSAPTINASRFGGTVQIQGVFALADVTDLVTVLKYGALPNPIEEVSFSKISPTLGLNFLQQSVLAGAIGIGIIFIFMLIHYRLPGLVACVALIYYSLLVFAIFRLIPITLTLAGVAAFVLSVAMAVDANILIFERTKEELRAGKTLVSAVEAGFNRAWNSIFDSNMSSIITAAILFYFGSAVIRGFALVLIIGVLVSMFSAITVSREVMRWLVRQPRARRASFFGVEEDEFTVASPRGRSREAGASV